MSTVLNLSSGPHIRDRRSTPFLMYVVALALLPAAAVGVWVSGLRALWVILTSVITAVGTEFFYDKLMGKPDTWRDGSALVTGLLLAMTLSADTPLYAPILGSLFAILVVKCAFGGLGKNFINPALTGRCFLLISFPNAMTSYSVDGVTGATPLAQLAAGNVVNVTKMFLGTAGGVIGSCTVALLIGGLLLWALDIIHGQICFSILGGFVLFLGLFGGKGFDPGFLAAHLCGGGVMLAAFFMATDYVTSPVSRLGQTVYGLLIGVLGAIFRVFGTAADSFSYAVIIGNLFVPLIDTYIIPKPYAFRKGALAAQNGEVKPPLSRRVPKPVIALALITLVAGLALSGTYSLTKDAIEEQKRAANKAAYQAVCPDAETFTGLDDKVAKVSGDVYGSGFGRVTINEAVEGFDAAGNSVGYAISATSAEGYDGNITLYVGVAPDGSLRSISFTELHETPGKGMLCDEPAFKDQFSGKNVSAFKINAGSGDEKIDGVTGATVSSRAVVNAVNAALDFYQTHIKGVN
ncbi:MAG: RnfABCDGE type electron transport complex subunit D [Lachnospiraceae bacterium]|nr:RnfABCDGE type electron transport complex subunit D [Lachnospiraceae bacterium]